MKLTMKNNYSFQKAEGYLDDPDMMSVDEVKEQLRYWHSLLEDMDANAQLPSDLVYLSSFVKSLADGDVEYEEPLKKYGYHAGFEYYDNFEVIAESQEKADEAALKLFKAMAEGMPQRINEATGCFEFLEQYDPDYGCGNRIYEG